MTERLPNGYPEKLAAAIWYLAEVSMSRLIAVTPAPALVKGEVHHDDLCLEPELEITRTMPDALRVRPTKLGLWISEKEPYALDKSLTLYSYKMLRLDTTKRSRSYETGVILYGEDGSSVTPRLDRPAAGMPRRWGNVDWQTFRNSEVAKFGVGEADYFLDTIDLVTNKIVHG